MIKSITLISLSILLLTLSLNVSLNIHYCHDELIEISFSNHVNNHCCAKMKKNDCNFCKNVHIELDNEQDKINFDFKIEFNQLNIAPYHSKTPTSYKVLANLDFDVLNGSDSSPPKLYLLYSKYCFYG